MPNLTISNGVDFTLEVGVGDAKGTEGRRRRHQGCGVWGGCVALPTGVCSVAESVLLPRTFINFVPKMVHFGAFYTLKQSLK